MKKVNTRKKIPAAAPPKKVMPEGHISNKHFVAALSLLAIAVVGYIFSGDNTLAVSLKKPTYATRCTDKDSLDTAVKNTVISIKTNTKTKKDVSVTKKTDSCVGTGSVKEYYCNINTTAFKIIPCGDGTKCSKGACVATSTPSSTPASILPSNPQLTGNWCRGSAAYCEDSTGARLEGKCIGDETNEPTCETLEGYTSTNDSFGNLIYEGKGKCKYQKNNCRLVNDHTCLVNQTDKTPRCAFRENPDPDSCLDSDGDNPNRKGSISYSDSNLVRHTVADYCSAMPGYENSVTEMVCIWQDQNIAHAMVHRCTEGKVCRDGTCVLPEEAWCQGTDIYCEDSTGAKLSGSCDGDVRQFVGCDTTPNYTGEKDQYGNGKYTGKGKCVVKKLDCKEVNHGTASCKIENTSKLPTCYTL